MKKLLMTFVTIALLAVCLCVPAFAAENDPADLVAISMVSEDFDAMTATIRCSSFLDGVLLDDETFDVDVAIMGSDSDFFELCISVLDFLSLGIPVNWFGFPVTVISEEDMSEGNFSICIVSDRVWLVSDRGSYFPVDFDFNALLPSASLTVSDAISLGLIDSAEVDSAISSLNDGYPGHNFTLESSFSLVLSLCMTNLPYLGELSFPSDSTPDSLGDTITAGVTSAASWVGTYADTLVAHPLIFVGALLGFIGFGIGIFKRFRT